MTNVSVLILTKNEEINLPGCLESVSWSNDIHVFDSFSDDKTINIARSYNASVTQRKFDNWSSHQNWGLQNIKFKNPWVLYIDADERVTLDLANAVLNAIAAPGDLVAFRLRRRDFFMKKWLKHVQTSPFYILLFRPEKMHYERLVNPISIPNGKVGELYGYLDHFPFSKGVSNWIDRHNSYSTLEAQQIVENRKINGVLSIRKVVFCKDFNERRFHQKELFYSLPFRPLLKFLILYLGKRGFLDGRAGFTYAILQSIYEYFIVLKTRELESQDNN